MDKSSAKNLISDLFTHKFDDKKYQNQFLPNLLGSIEGSSTFEYSGNLIKHKFKDTVAHFKRYAKHTLSDGNVIDLLYVKLHSGKSLDKNRNSLRNYIASYLSDKSRDAALVVFVENDFKRWRLSFIRLDHSLSVTAKGSITTKEIATPAKRYSFLLGDGEASHTAQNQFIGQLSSSVKDVSLNQLEELFAVDKLNDEFFEEYKKLLEKTKNGILSAARESNYYQVVEEAIKTKDGSYIKYRLTSDKATIDVNNFTKKLLGQLVFLYFLQKKGWLGVAKDKNWGEGNIHFLRSQFTSSSQDNFFGKVLEPLFYEALATERDQSYYVNLDCRIPFLNGGLFEVYNGYDWVNHKLNLSNDLFSNTDEIKDSKNSISIKGTGILDVFDRYNFTVCEDDPLDKEVAIDPEMLGQIFENTIEENERKGNGAFYTPRQIVHYMVKQSLIEYLTTHLDYINAGAANVGDNQVTVSDLEILVNNAEFCYEHDKHVVDIGDETDTYKYLNSRAVRNESRATKINELLANITILDPAVGSGAFPVGLLIELVKVRKLLSIYTKQNLSVYELKLHAITNSIYGVDIDAGAIDIARLRLWLSLIVDENDHDKINALPNLDYKIIYGNSLTA